MKNYLHTMQAKIDRYKTKYATKPLQAYFRLTFISLKYPLGRLFPSKRKKLNEKFDLDQKNLNIAFLLHGGLGDVFTSAKYVKAVKNYIDSDHIIDIYSGKHLHYVESVFLNQNIHNNLYLGFPNNDSYDIVISFLRRPTILKFDEERVNSFSVKVANFCKAIQVFKAQNPALTNYSNTCLEKNFFEIQNVKRHEQGDINGILNLRETSFILQYDKEKESILEKHKLTSKKYITLQRSISSSSRDATKLWPKEFYEELIQMLKNYAPEYQIVQIGTAEARSINGTDLNLCGKTSLEELKVVLKHALFHVDGDTGTMHMRHVLGEKSFVIWGPTNNDFSGYEEDTHFYKSPCAPHACEGLTESWNDICLKSKSAYAPCMHAITPQMVFDKLKEELDLINSKNKD